MNSRLIREEESEFIVVSRKKVDSRQIHSEKDSEFKEKKIVKKIVNSKRSRNADSSSREITMRIVLLAESR